MHCAQHNCSTGSSILSALSIGDLVYDEEEIDEVAAHAQLLGVGMWKGICCQKFAGCAPECLGPVLQFWDTIYVAQCPVRRGWSHLVVMRIHCRLPRAMRVQVGKTV